MFIRQKNIVTKLLSVLVAAAVATTAVFSAASLSADEENIPDISSGTAGVADNSVEPYVSYVVGDADGNKVVNIKDCVIMQRSLMGNAVISGINSTAADVNRDGNITLADIVQVMRYLIGYSDIWNIGEEVFFEETTYPGFEEPTEEPTQPPTYTPPTPNESGAGQFLMVSQQTALNENRSNSNGYSSGKSLNKISNSNGQVFYEGDTNARFQYNRTYFPVVMDRTFMCNTQMDNSVPAAYNQGIYFLGDFHGAKVNDAARSENNGNSIDLGNVSYFEENTDFGQSIRCALLVIKNNFVTRSNNGITNAPKVEYYGDGDKNLWNGEYYVYIYLPKTVKFWLCDENRYVYRDLTFARGAGYWMVKSGKSLYDQSAWKPLNSSLLQQAMDLNMYDQIMSYYDDNGEIHTGSNETELGSSNVKIVGNNGGYIYSYTSGYDNARDVDNYPFDQDRSRMNIFFAPNMSPQNTGYYHWYAGRSFNMQWFRSDTRYQYNQYWDGIQRVDQTGIDADFVVGNNVNIRISSPTVVLTIHMEQPYDTL